MADLFHGRHIGEKLWGGEMEMEIIISEIHVWLGLREVECERLLGTSFLCL